MSITTANPTAAPHRDITPDLQAAIAAAARRCCLGTLPPGAIAQSLTEAVRQSLANGMSEAVIQQHLEALQP